MKKEELLQVQTIVKEILSSVVKICENHNIDYYLMFGTLIGAVRHKDIIPWDDDVDIGMTRENCNLFLKYAKKELDKKYDIMIMGSGSNETYFEVKIFQKNALYCIEGAERLNIANHVLIDIFVLDNIKPQSKSSKKLIKVLSLISLNKDEKKLILLSRKNKSVFTKLIDTICLLFLHFIRSVFREKNIQKIIFRMCVDKTNDSDLVGCALFLENCTWNKSFFAEKIKLQYGNNYYFAPKEFDKVLRITYGDYMQLPPEDKRYKPDLNKWIFEIIER